MRNLDSRVSENDAFMDEGVSRSQGCERAPPVFLQSSNISIHKQKRRSDERRFMYGTPKGIRTPVTAVKGRCPRPLDDGSVL